MTQSDGNLLGLFAIRWVLAFALVMLTYNPTGLSFVHWVVVPNTSPWSVKALFGIVLLIGYVIYLRATWRSIGAFGILLVVALFAAGTWVLFDMGVLSLEDPGAMTWIAILVAATIMGVGLSWSHIRRRLSGQADVEDVEP